MTDPSRTAAIIGVGSSPYGRSRPESREELAAMAARAAIVDAGLDRQRIDGMTASVFQVSPQTLQQHLGIEVLRWWLPTITPFSFPLLAAADAVVAGRCAFALAYQAQRRTSATSAVAAADPGRAEPDPARTLDRHGVGPYYAPFGTGPAGYAGFMRRYLDTYGLDRSGTARVSVNGRAWAMGNDRAVMRTPLTLEDYLDARPVRDPMVRYDMDVPIDGADALVVTTLERARDCVERPVVLAAHGAGQLERCGDDAWDDVALTGQTMAGRALWERTPHTLADVDLLCLYDGFTIITLLWLESLGLCEPGGATEFLATHWDAAAGRVLVGGRIPINPHGGSLSEGATQGAGHLREAVLQVRGDAGDRQVEGCRVAVVAVGGLFNNANAFLLTTDPDREP